MKKWLAAIANFFFPGLGYLVFGASPRRALGALWLPGVVGLTYVELALKPLQPQLYWIMFASVFVMNIAFAIDGYRDAAG